MRQADLARNPVRSAQTAHDVHGDGHGGVGNVVGSFQTGLGDGVGERRHAAADNEPGYGAPVMQMQIANEVIKGRTDVASLPDEQSNGTQR